MPIVNKLFGKGAGGWKAFRNAGTWRTTKAMSRQFGKMRGLRNAPARAILGGTGIAADLSVLMTRTSAKVLGKTANAMGRHPITATTLGTMGLGGLGAARGMSRMAAAVTPTYPAAPRTGRMGMGFETWGRPAQRRINASDVGATGQLTLALHRTRHR